MKILADSCVGRSVVQRLRDDGHDVAAMSDAPPDPGDDAVLALAIAEERALLTLDKDFGELVVVHGAVHHGIVRLVDLSLSQQADRASSVFREHETDLRGGALITVEASRTRIRPREA